MLIGEKPGEAESRIGRPFVGPAGHILDTYLSAAAIDRQSLYITNCVKEFTSYTKPTKEELDRDKPELIQEIMLCEPEVIGLVGAYAVCHVLGWEKADMDRRHGIPMRVQSLFGNKPVNGVEWTVMPLYHPAQVIHAPEMSPTVLDDYLRLGMLLDGEIEPLQPDITDEQLDYRVVTASDLDDILTPSCTICDLMGVDTEGHKNKPWSLQFSINRGQSFLIRGSDREALQKFFHWLRRMRPANGSWFISLQNALHDLPVLRSMEIELEEGSYRDTMIWAYLLCVEPQGLKPLAYRHAGMLQDSYDDVIGDVGWSIAMDYLCRVASQEWPSPEAEIVKDGTGSRVKKPQGVNKLVNRILGDIASGKVNKDGEPPDPRERWKKLSPAAKAPVIAAMGDMREPDLDDVPFERASRYAIRDADCQFRITRPLEDKIKAMELEKASAIDHAILPMIDRMMEIGIQLAPVSFWDDIDAQCDRQMAKAQYNIYKFSGRDINPGSGDQVAEYLFGAVANGGLGLKPSRMTDSGARGSVDAVSLEGLLSQSAVIQDFMDYTEAQKIKGTYVEPLKELCQIGDGRARATIRTTRTTTGRLSMADPPLHQIPIMTDLGRQLRGGFVAPEGRCIGSYDFSHLEMRMCAHDSQDDLLCKMFWDGRDIHAETACKIFSVPMGNLSVDSRGKVDDPRRTVAKHCIAEGQLVLTNKGLVPIEKITVEHKLWDGVEWVHHDGLVYQGFREVMTYDGLTATSDHEVFIETEEGFAAKKPFGEVASSMGRIITTGNAEQAIRSCCGDIFTGQKDGEERLDIPQVSLSGLRRNQLEDEVQSAAKGLQRMQGVQPYQVRQAIPQQVRTTVHRYPATLQHSALPWIRGLRRSRYQMSFPFEIGIRILGREAFAAQGLCWSHNRSYRQQRPLRTWESTVGQHVATESKSAQYSASIIQGSNGQRSRFRQSLLFPANLEVHSNGMDRGRYHTKCRQRSRFGGSAAWLEKKDQVAKLARVYDILNAGPRKRFTVSNKLISNCAFGIINGITEHGVVNYLILNRCRRPDGEPWTLDDCEMILKEWFNIYKGVKRFQQECIEETRATGIARETIGGRIIYLPQIWSQHKTTRETAERMSYVMHTQGGGQSIVKLAMAPVWKELCRDRSLGIDSLFQMHDELLFELPDREEERQLVDVTVRHIFENTTKLRVPVKCAGGFGANWLQAH